VVRPCPASFVLAGNGCGLPVPKKVHSFMLFLRFFYVKQKSSYYDIEAELEASIDSSFQKMKAEGLIAQ
jgi:hypothetical protein